MKKNLMEASLIPSGSTVTKPGGEKLYELIHGLRIFHNNEKFRSYEKTTMDGIYLIGVSPATLMEIPPSTKLQCLVCDSGPTTNG